MNRGVGMGKSPHQSSQPNLKEKKMNPANGKTPEKREEKSLMKNLERVFLSHPQHQPQSAGKVKVVPQVMILIAKVSALIRNENERKI